MRKKFLVMAFAMSMTLAFTGCKSSDYKQAQSLYEEGKYEEAATIFEELGDYEDSADQLLASKYLIACGLQNEGKYDDAITMYDELGDFEKTAENKEKCNLAKACQLIEEKNYEDALAIVQDMDCEEGKHFADICNVHINGMDGLIEFMKENIELNKNGENAESIYTGKDGSVKVLLYYDNSSNELKAQSYNKNKADSDPRFDMVLSGDKQGEYEFIQTNFRKVNSAYAYYYETLMIGNDYYVGYNINAFGKVNLAKFDKDKDVKMDKFYFTASSDDYKESEFKDATKVFLNPFTICVLEGIQSFLNEHDLRMSLADLGFAKYQVQFSDDPYSSPVSTTDYSADTTISNKSAETTENN